MRIFFASLATETNTYAPFPTALAGFEEEGIFRGNGSVAGDSPMCRGARRIAELAKRDGHQFVEGLTTFAQPSGRTLRSVYEGFRQEIVDALSDGGRFDIVFLFLHGAMAADGYDDCEGDLAAHVRAVVGPDCVIGMELDPHCHLTNAMVSTTNAIVIMKEYPHDDYLERAEELYHILVDTAESRIVPVSAVFDCRMVGFYPTTRQPMRSIVDALHKAEQKPGILSVSFVHGFPWADIADVGSKVLVIADRSAALAVSTASEIGHGIYALRDELLPRFPPLDEALDIAQKTPGRVVLADTADNAGGGAPSDSTFLLRAILDRGLRNVATGCYWDPMAVRACMEAGAGSRLTLRIGGKVSRMSGMPADVDVVVRAVHPNHDEDGLGGARQGLGDAAWVEADGGIDIVLTSMRAQTFAPDAFTGLGIDLLGKRLICVKSSHHFHTRFAPIADHIIHAGTPGTMQMDFANMPYTRRDGVYHPRVNDPLLQPCADQRPENGGINAD